MVGCRCGQARRCPGRRLAGVVGSGDAAWEDQTFLHELAAQPRLPGPLAARPDGAGAYLALLPDDGPESAVPTPGGAPLRSAGLPGCVAAPGPVCDRRRAGE